ncbi:MAG: aminotransferase class I/II-fold pyridoxal phosphate-dependent enzyme [Candidatus Moranbacteria bacterium]|nr:aminotransferase class I/II-fold pyridoxal phosphate-dependent enzyme [Candidatus Moranbacteria bacterium]
MNNPTSVLYEKERLLSIVKEFPDVIFVVDETYLLFRSDFSSLTLSDSATTYENLFVIMSLSKFFSLPGIRLGVMVSGALNRENYMNGFHIPYSVNPLAAPALRGGSLMTRPCWTTFVSDARQGRKDYSTY